MSWPTHSSELPAGRGRILIIDDAPDIHKIISAFLQPLDVELAHAFGGQEGLKMAARFKPSLILLDYMMPEYDGIQVLEALKSNVDLRDIPVIMITADEQRSLMSMAFDKGVSDYVNKPLQKHEFRARVQSVLRNQALVEELRRESQFDSLTGLLNRTSLVSHLQRAADRCRCDQGMFAVMFVDFDQFKLINDSLGHVMGDRVLHLASRRLRQSLRKTDIVSESGSAPVVARLGGDEFVVMLDSISSKEDVDAVAERVLARLLEPYELDHRTLYLNASIGVVIGDSQYESADDILRDADIAMYAAKESGRGCYRTFDVRMRDRAQNRWLLDRDLRRAVEEKQFFLQYQPVVDLQSGAVESVEALIRWKHPERGFVSPAEFIPMAEESGIIHPIGQWVVEEACRQFSEWRQVDANAAPKRININIARQQIVQPGFPDFIRAVLMGTDTPASRVVFEVTESQIMDDLDTSLKTLNEIRGIGSLIALDDFGTGHSSLACLHQLPFDVLKLDRSLISTIEEGRYFRNLVGLIVNLFDDTEISVVAEGIETQEQHDILLSLGCTFGQGYLFARPLNAEDVPGYIFERKRQRQSLCPQANVSPTFTGSTIQVPNQPSC